MALKPDIDDVTAGIRESIEASAKRQRRLRSKTLWGAYKIRKRTDNLVAEVADSLDRNSILLTMTGDRPFGEETKDEWIILSVQEPHPPDGTTTVTTDVTAMPSDDWFETMGRREFESEREVEYYFVVPLLERLGYGEDDLSVGQVVEMYEGVKKVKKEADVVVYDGTSRDLAHALIVVEAKRSATLLTADSAGQTRGYSIWTSAPYYLVTNGHEVQVWLFRGAVQSDVRLMKFDRSDLRSVWTELYAKLNRAAVVQYKRRLAQSLT